MLRHKNARNPLQKSDAPSVPGTSEKEIARNQGPSITMDSSLERPPLARTTPTPGLGQRIEQKTWENDQLRQKLELEQRKYLYLLEEVKLVVESLQHALLNLHEFSSTDFGDWFDGGK
jgi:hypothetical protein